MEGIEAEMFFTLFGLKAVHTRKHEKLHVATVGNPAMHIPTMLGGGYGSICYLHDEKRNGEN